ncbi:MAG: urea carboxylase-associated family protein [Chloroflexi bacterium]|nr:urea carboxylase-associated family protein [Chloroflexota bacterium]
MKLLEDAIVRRNTGAAFTLREGQHIRVIGESIVDFVAFNLADLRERFDQARTKINAGSIFISRGDTLVSKRNNVMLTILEDSCPLGTHDLQAGMCSRASYLSTYESGRWPEVSASSKEELPDHGCWENLTEALRPWNIASEDIPSPFNIFQIMEIDGRTGAMHFSSARPEPGSFVELRAEMSCLVAVSACPAGNKDKDVRIRVFEP